jgi:CubicO group peptidase (beta-lactamase class C family)
MRSCARSWHSFLAAAFLLGTGCGGSVRSTPPPENASAEDGSAPGRPERKLDERIHADNLHAQLTPYVESIGAGFGPGYHATGFVAVSGAGKRLYEHAFGHADRESEAENTAETLFRVGGITKQFTAAATLLLAESGKVDLGARIAKYLPEYPSPGANITLHQLLSHTSGLPDYMSNPALSQRAAQPKGAAAVRKPRELLELFWKLPLEFEPGSDFRYGESGYAVLGAIIERISGQGYAEHMQSAIFDRFGLAHTTAGTPAEGSEVARGYTAGGDSGLSPARSVDPSVLFAGAGVSSGASDLLLWHDALQTGRVLSGELEAAYYQPVRSRHAYGWFIDDSRGIRTLRHGGNLDGFATQYARVPELDLAIAVLCNNSSIDASAILDAALRAVLGEKVAPLEAGKGIPVDPSIPPRITGIYKLSDGSADELKQRKIPKKTLLAMLSVRIYDEHGTLYFRPVGQSAVPMIATGPGRFILLGGKAKIEVQLDPDESPATVLLLEQGPLRAEFTRRARVRGKSEEAESPPEGIGSQPKDEPAP